MMQTFFCFSLFFCFPTFGNFCFETSTHRVLINYATFYIFSENMFSTFQNFFRKYVFNLLNLFSPSQTHTHTLPDTHTHSQKHTHTHTLPCRLVQCSWVSIVALIWILMYSVPGVNYRWWLVFIWGESEEEERLRERGFVEGMMAPELFWRWFISPSLFHLWLCLCVFVSLLLSFSVSLSPSFFQTGGVCVCACVCLWGGVLGSLHTSPVSG